jgi:hypothetical protein
MTVTKRGSANIYTTKSGKIVGVVVGGKRRAGGPIGKQLVKPKAPVRKYLPTGYN